jgi:hypothetical protein
MHDNKLRLSADIILKAEEIAQTWGLKNSRAAIEAVFRKYADDYLYGRQPAFTMPVLSESPTLQMPTMSTPETTPKATPIETNCQASNELDSLLGL